MTYQKVSETIVIVTSHHEDKKHEISIVHPINPANEEIFISCKIGYHPNISIWPPKEL